MRSPDTIPAMTYPRNLLNDGEEIVLDHHPHWMVMASSVAMLSLAIVLTIVLTVADPLFGLLGLLCIFFAAVGTVGQVLKWRCTNFVVTTDRLIVRSGILSKTGLEIPLDRITNIAFHQTFVERLVKSGDIVVESAGEQGHQRFSDVADPTRLQNIIYRQAEIASDNHRSRGSSPESDGTGHTSSGHPLSIPEQIEKLDELRRNKIISEAEFVEKKQELLDRI